jgi:hypothetical protein
VGKTPDRAADAGLLELLIADARLSTAALARRLGVARSTAIIACACTWRATAAGPRRTV